MRYLLPMFLVLIGLVTTVPAQAYSTTTGWSTQSRTIVLAAERVGVDATTLSAIGWIESRFNPRAVNRHTQATGMFQYKASTWRSHTKRYGRAYGITPGTPRTNALANATMAAIDLKRHQDALRKVLGRPPVPGEQYMAHWLGLGGATRILKAPGYRNAAVMFPAAAAKNKSLFYTSKGKPRTVRQLRDYVNWKFGVIGAQFEQDVEILTARL